MPELEIEWSVEDQVRGADAFYRLKVGDEPAVLEAEDWANAIIHLMRETSHVVHLAYVRDAYPDQLLTEMVKPQQVVDGEETEGKAQEHGVGPMYYAARASCQAIYRGARRTTDPPMGIGITPPWLEGSDLPTATLGAYSGRYSRRMLARARDVQLGVPIPVLIALSVVGIAAVAGLSWWGTEQSDKTMRVDIEKARSAAKVEQSVLIAKAQIAAGRPVKLPVEVTQWGDAAKTQSSPLYYAGVGFGVAAVAAGAAVAGAKLGAKG